MKCSDCPTQIPNGRAVIRSISFKRVALCKPCAVDRGWIARTVDADWGREPVQAQAARR